MYRQARIAGLLLTTTLATGALAGTGYAAATGPARAVGSTTGAASARTPAGTSGAFAARSRGGPLSGSWSGGYSGAYGGTFKFSWRQSGSKLSGHITLAHLGTFRLTGSVSGGSIRFGTVGGPAITYRGSVSGSSMSGTYKTPRGGGSWHAHRS